jgi:predicted ribosome quality control (RQC) complex YloA/Tae2 family protein
MKLETKYISQLGINIEFQIGKNAYDNFDIIDAAYPDDLWFHINENASCHVIATMPDDMCFDKKQLMYIIKQGAILCKQHSKYKSQKKTSIIYTKIKYVTLTNIPGKVELQISKTLTI